MKGNPNTSVFWDSLMDGKHSVYPGDHITQDRIRFISRLIPNRNIMFLDIGTGYGFLERRLNNSNVLTYGIDISHRSILRVKGLYHGFFTVASALAIPFKSDLFDYVCVSEVLEHLYDNESVLVMREIGRVLKSDGKLIISVPLFDMIYSGHPSGHVREFTPDRLFKEIDDNGFMVLKKRYLFAFESLYYVKNFINKMLKIRHPNNLIVLAEKRCY